MSETENLFDDMNKSDEVFITEGTENFKAVLKSEEFTRTKLYLSSSDDDIDDEDLDEDDDYYKVDDEDDAFVDEEPDTDSIDDDFDFDEDDEDDLFEDDDEVPYN